MLCSSTIFGRLGDTIGRKRIVTLGFLVSGVVFFLHTLIRDFPSLFIIRGLAGIGVGMIPGPLAALASSGSIGVFTAFGSFGFMLSSILAGVLQKEYFVFTVASLMCAVGFLFSFTIREKVKRIPVPLFPWKIIRRNLDVYLPYLIRHSAASAIWAIFPIYLAMLGANRFHIGILYGINPLMQFSFMLLFARIRSKILIPLGLVTSAIVFLGYALVQRWELVLFLQALLGFSWANLYLGSMKQLLDTNIEQATATGVLNSIFGLSGICGPLIGGIITLVGMRALMFFACGLACVAFITSRSLRLPAR